MKPVEPLSLRHGWPFHDRQHRFVLGRILDGAAPVLGEPGSRRGLGPTAVGQWECDLSRNKLSWSDEVYDIFGLRRGDLVSRDEPSSRYWSIHAREEGFAPLRSG